MIIQIDNREKDIIKLCNIVLESDKERFKNISLEVKPLPIGDILLINDGIETVIIERKTILDLSSSIKDGRYEEQSYRLNGSLTHNHNIIYLIEGNFCQFPNIMKNKNINKITLYSAMVSLNYYKGFSVLNTNDINETAIMICNMAHKIYTSALKGRLPYYSNKVLKETSEEKVIKGTAEETDIKENIEELEDININDDKDYCSVIKKVKKDNITPENIGEIMLCQIPGISSTTSIALMEKFKTLPNLIHCIKEDEKSLENISYKNSKGQLRKISKTALLNVVKYLKI